MPFATEEKTAEGFKAVGERVDEIELNTTTAVKELAETIKTIREQQKLYRNLALNRQPGNEDKTRFWPDDEHAKAFGEIILAALRHKTMTESAGTGEGGVLVPIDLAGFIIQKMNEYGVFRRNVARVSMGSSSLLVPKVTDDMTIYCPGESGKIDESDVGLGQVSLVPKKLACLGRISSELEEDSVMAIGEIMGQSIARSMAKAEDMCGFLGNGTSTYFNYVGVLGALRAVDAAIANIKSLVVGSGNAYSELTLADFRKVVGLLPPGADANAKWFMSKKFFYSVVYPLAEAAGVASIFEILSNQQGRFLLGYPVEFTSCLPSTEANSQICALLGDLQLGAFLGERRLLNIARSDQFHFDTDEIAIRGLERIAINVYGVGDTTDPGPICGLITAAA
jgi:HK97 family phage major capsid protein